jgi:DUF1680 family protein
VKLYCTPTDSFWCCTGTGMENHAKYGDSIYFHDDAALYVNLFIASELHWAERNLRIVQTTNFPDQDATRLVIHAGSPTHLALKIRHPSWCSSVTIAVNGRRHVTSDTPGRYIDVDRTWRDGDVVDVHLPMQLRLEPLPNASSLVAVMYGPIVLAGRLGTEGLSPGADLIVNERTSGDVLDIPTSIPQLAVNPDIRRTSAQTLSFSAHTLRPDRKIELVPWHRVAHERYALYWHLGARDGA